MKSTGVKVVELTNEEMLNHKSQEYNPTEWKRGVKRMIDIGAKFYESKPEAGRSWTEFYTIYTIPEGLKFLSNFSPYSSMLTNDGFKRAFVIDGEIWVNGFGPEGTQSVVNNKQGRKWLKESMCAHGIAITSCF